MRRSFLFAFLLLFFAVSSFAAHLVYSPGRPLTDADRAELASRGIVVQRAMTGGRYIVVVESTTTRDAITASSVDEFAPLTPEQKIHRTAIRMAAKGKPVTRLRVMFHRDVTFEEARQAVLASGATFEDPLAFELGVMQQIDVLVPAGSLEALASDDRVFVVAGTPAMKIRTDNTVSAALSHVTELHTAPYDLTGEGVNASLFELAEAQANHPEFGERLKVNTTGGSTLNRQHATHVAGTIAASGVEPQAKGMAPKVSLHQFRASGTPSQWLTTKDRTLPTLGVVVDNNSWGYVLGWDSEGSDWVWTDLAELFGAYDLILTAPIDQITRERGILFVHSAGNEARNPNLNSIGQHRHVDPDTGDTITDRWFCYSTNGSGNDCPSPCSVGACEVTRHLAGAPYDTIGVTASAKNSIAVGAIDSSKGIAGFSSRGPAKDGRVKPDLVARGVNVFSASPSSTYLRKDGTSMASPAVAGMAILVTEQWRRTFGRNPTPEQLKALLIAGAEDLGNTGPDYTFGYGLANAKASVDLIRDDAGQGTHIHPGALAHGGRFDTALRITEAQNLRVTLQWLDPEIVLIEGESEVAPKALVNNLDLTVTDPAGNVVLPWLLNPDARTTAATRAVNNRDNTEVIEIANATPGIYRIAVNATAILERSPQSFTLVTNVATPGPCRDAFEVGNVSETAYDLVPDRPASGALCSTTDIDFYRFTMTKGTTLSVTVQATGDTGIRATVLVDGTSGGGPVDTPAGQTSTLTAFVELIRPGTPTNVVVKIEPMPNAQGIVPTYTITPKFGITVLPRRRTAGK